MLKKIKNLSTKKRLTIGMLIVIFLYAAGGIVSLVLSAGSNNAALSQYCNILSIVAVVVYLIFSFFTKEKKEKMPPVLIGILAYYLIFFVVSCLLKNKDCFSMISGCSTIVGFSAVFIDSILSGHE